MRKAAVALLAAPVVLLVYLEFALRRSVAARVALIVGVAGMLGVGAIGGLAPLGTTAAPTGADSTELPTAAFKTHVLAGHPLDESVAIAFSRPMDAASVAAAVRVEPDQPVELAWDATGQELTIAPSAAWSPDTYYVVTVGVAAQDRAGQALDRPARAAFLTRAATAVAFSAGALVDGRARVDARLSVRVRGSVDRTALAEALRVVPVTAGRVNVVTDDDGMLAEFVPTSALLPDTAYTVSLASALTDSDGGTIAAPRPLTVRTAAVPSVVRFRPRPGTKDVSRDANLSVRFDQRMDRRSTAAAFSASIDGKPIKGKLRWYEDDTVLLLDPANRLPEGVSVVLAVAPTARSAAGLPIPKLSSATFTTVPKPAPKPTATARPAAKTTTTRSSGATRVGGSSWSAVEAYYLKLLNCTRGGGLVTSSGSCSSPGGSGLAPLTLSSGLTTKVSRPYAKLLAVNGVCSHTYGSTLASRLQRAGYTGFTWAGENLGCRSGDPYAAVLGSHLFFQSERTYNGGHWRNIMDRRFSLVGIGVWVSGGRVRLVTNFYAP